MKTFRVYYKIPAHAWIEVQADGEAEALAVAEKERQDGDDCLTDFEPDWDATAEHCFTMEVETDTPETTPGGHDHDD